MSTLKFYPYQSAVDPGFWHTLAKKKLEEFKLSEECRPMTGTVSLTHPPQSVPGPRLSLPWDALSTNTDSTVWNHAFVNGEMFLLNTIESFKQLDKSEWLKKQGEKVWDTIQTGKFWQNPETLRSFSVIIYADLKKFHFYYWLNFPSFSIRNDVKVVSSVKISDSPMAGTCDSLSTAAVDYRKANQNSLFTLVKLENEKWTFQPFSDLKELPKDELCKAEYFVGLFDPCSATEYPSWTLRNMIVALTSTHPDLLANIKFLSIRMVIKEGTYDVSESLITKLECDDTIDSTMPNVVGWEKNEKGQLGPRFVNMRSSMDPVKIAESSVDLNLKLMKWRLVPDLNLDAVANAKFLLLGAGTLGCGVARCLLGWGARNIIFLDNAKVSYSNPVRQSLYEFKDCLDGGKKKSVAAAEKLKEIFPGVVSNSYEMTIPMPGHPIAQSLEPEAKSAYDTLKTLIDESDVIFLLMDSRESRWLPTVMTAAHPEKILINAALGFDTYLVMRHGVRHEGHVTNPSHQLTAESLSGKDLGCYYCNDVVAPGDSLSDRTLDMQCTVTRPGVSAIASALAVELAVSCLQHPERGAAPCPAPVGGNKSSNEINAG